MPDIPLDHVLRLEPKAPPPAYTPPEYSAEAAPPAYTSTPAANYPSVSPHHDERIHSFRRNEPESQLPPRDKRPTWRRTITRRYCGVPGWILLVLIAVGVIVGGVVGNPPKQAKKVPSFRSNYWYTIGTASRQQKHSSLFPDMPSGDVRLLSETAYTEDKRWQLRKLVNISPWEDSCDGGHNGGNELYWMLSSVVGPTKRLGFKEKLFTQEAVEASGLKTLELELSDDPEDARSQLWYPEETDERIHILEGEYFERDAKPFRLWNCATKGDFVLGWQNSSTGTIEPVMVFAADTSQHMLWDIEDREEIPAGEGWQRD